MKKLAALLLTVMLTLSFSTVAMASVSPSGNPPTDGGHTSPPTGMDASVIYLGTTAVMLGGLAVTAAKKLED